MPSDVQYIATQVFLRTLLSGAGGQPADLLSFLDGHADFIADPGVDEAGSQGSGHRSEQAFIAEYQQNRRVITAEARQFELRNPDSRVGQKPLPYQLIAMALRHSPEGKRRVILTNDEGLMEWLHYFGIETMDTEAFVRTIMADRVRDKAHSGLDQLPHNSP